MIKVLELFSGYGSQSLALEYLGIEYKSDISEIDQYAIKAYNQIHGDTHNWGDITKIDETKLPYYDLITYSSPCQDFSVAGLGKGGDEGSGTRSSLLWECERIIRAVKPKYLLMENVKNLVGKAHKHNFIRWLRTLEMMGYQNFWQVLNAKDYGVPQNRERVFVVSILGSGQYLFPNKIKLEKRLKDILEPEADEKYYLSDKICERFHYKKVGQDVVGSTLGEECTRKGNRDLVYGTEHTIGALTSTDYKQPKQILEPPLTSTSADEKIITIGNYMPSGHSASKIVDSDGITPTVMENHGTVTAIVEPKIVTYDIPDEKIIKKVGNPKVIEISQNAKHQQDLIQYQEGICRTIPAGTHGSTPHLLKTVVDNYRIRKLTPRECWRLMGVKDEQYDKLHDISNTQLYKMAGNSIVVDVLMGIFKNLFQSDDGTSGQLQLF
jgi:DNA (cytosine-5)-methyltransferase 1